MLGPTLQTERLILRPPAAEDFDAWAEMLDNPETATFIGGVMSRPLAWRAMAAMTGAWTLRGYSLFSILERSTGRCVGRAGPWRPEGWPGTEVGWALVRGAWGKGYAVEAASAAIDWAFDDLGWTEVIHSIHRDNARSAALAGRLGSSFLRTESLPGPAGPMECDIWGQSREAWFARAK